MLVIVNADDLGASQVINDSIFALMEMGVVTSATLMANGPSFKEAVERIPSLPHCSFGIHLTLTQFAPLSESRALTPVLENGQLSRKLFSTQLTAELRSALERELTVQVERVFETGIPVSHFDSHHFVHRDPRLFGIFKAVQRRFGIHRFRGPLLDTGKHNDLAKKVRRRISQFAWRHLYKTRLTECCTFADFHHVLCCRRVPSVAALDVMAHPGTARPDFLEETALLGKNWRSLLPRDAKLGTYNDL